MYLKTLTSIEQIGLHDWNQLLEDSNPFCSYQFLHALEVSESVSSDKGWQPLHLALYNDSDELIAVIPSYVKSHSYGEFVFDWSWANAYQANGLDYYPKLLSAIPMSPINGPRLFSNQEFDIQKSVIKAIETFIGKYDLSSWHINFVSKEQQKLFASVDLIERQDIQFHWSNAKSFYSGFDNFLKQLSAKKRRNILQERRKVEQQGWTFETLVGNQISEGDWQLFHQLYLHTFDKKGNWAQLNLSFFLELARSLSESIVIIFAIKDNQKKAAALFLQSETHLYGRYWGAIEQCPGLHFETCYYQGIEYAIKHQLKVFEPGAQGEHKLARGFLPVKTYSYHYVVNSEFRTAIQNSVEAESQHINKAYQYYMEHSPYKGKTLAT